MPKFYPFQEVYNPDCNDLSIDEKAQRFNLDGKPWDVLFAEQFNVPQLDALCELATNIRRLSKTKHGSDFLQTVLSDKSAVMYFDEPSSRTYLSFYRACEILGIKVVGSNDKKSSSESKGETKEDTIRTLSSYFDMVIMRSYDAGLVERVALDLHFTRPIPVINAGNGASGHPTQALLDLYTIKRSFKKNQSLKDLRIMFVGDMKNSRTVKSLSKVLATYPVQHMEYVAPEGLDLAPTSRFEIDNVIMNTWNKIADSTPRNAKLQQKTTIATSNDFDESIAKVEPDVIYMTRIQDERGGEGDDTYKFIDYEPFYLNQDRLDVMRRDAIIMHPLPRRQEIPTFVDEDRRAMYWRQVRNGMWIRTALIASIMGRDSLIRDEYAKQWR